VKKPPDPSLATLLLLAKTLRDPDLQPAAAPKKARSLAALGSPANQQAVLAILRAVGRCMPTATPPGDAIRGDGGSNTGAGKAN
jgi:hypothetical protein